MEAIRCFTQTRQGQDVDKSYKQTVVEEPCRSLTEVEIPGENDTLYRVSTFKGLFCHIMNYY